MKRSLSEFWTLFQEYVMSAPKALCKGKNYKFFDIGWRCKFLVESKHPIPLAFAAPKQFFSQISSSSSRARASPDDVDDFFVLREILSKQF